MSRHTLSVLVEDVPGVLARIASLFSRRVFNIESLAVVPPEHSGVQRRTIVATLVFSAPSRSRLAIARRNTDSASSCIPRFW